MDLEDNNKLSMSSLISNKPSNIPKSINKSAKHHHQKQQQQQQQQDVNQMPYYLRKFKSTKIITQATSSSAQSSSICYSSSSSSSCSSYSYASSNSSSQSQSPTPSPSPIYNTSNNNEQSSAALTSKSLQQQQSAMIHLCFDESMKSTAATDSFSFSLEEFIKLNNPSKTSNSNNNTLVFSNSNSENIFTDYNTVN